jgi:hypothetical protein
MARRRARRRKSKQSYGELQAALSAKERPIENLESDLYAEIEADFNLLIKATVADLTSDAAKGGYSPVLTGFFASNWKAGTSAISKTENIKGTEWDKIRKKTIKIGTKTKTVLAPGQSSLIKQRHSVPEFSLKNRVFIGNAAKYSSYALMSPKSRLVAYLSGGGGGTTSINQRIDEIMTDRKASIKIGAGVEGGAFFGRLRTKSEPGFTPRTGYTSTQGS